MQKLCNRGMELSAHMHQVESNQANSSQNHYLSDNCLAASAKQVRQVYTTQFHHQAGLREPAQVWEAALPRQCAAVSGLISGCLGHSPAASKTTAGFLHSTSLSRHTSPFRASTPCQPCAARDRKVSRSVKATTALPLAGTGSPDLSWGAGTHNTSRKCSLPKRHRTKWWKHSCTNLFQLPRSHCKQLCAALSWWADLLRNTYKRPSNFHAEDFKECYCSTFCCKRHKMVILWVHRSASGTFN